MITMGQTTDDYKCTVTVDVYETYVCMYGSGFSVLILTHSHLLYSTYCTMLNMHHTKSGTERAYSQSLVPYQGPI